MNDRQDRGGGEEMRWLLWWMAGSGGNRSLQVCSYRSALLVGPEVVGSVACCFIVILSVGWRMRERKNWQRQE